MDYFFRSINYIFSFFFAFTDKNYQREGYRKKKVVTASNMPSAYALGSFLTLLGLSMVLDCTLAQPNSQPQVCPTVGEITPCVCQVKKNGLDILCEATDLHHINKAMSALKGKSPVIFYLKLRHNNLPKLQGFVFLALDIRHLTIHNSSLAAIEETSLSSLGKFGLRG
jgi:hypothetical protein